MKRPEMIWVWEDSPGCDSGRWTVEKATKLAIPYTPHNPAREAAVREVVEAAQRISVEWHFPDLKHALAKLAALDGEEG